MVIICLLLLPFHSLSLSLSLSEPSWNCFKQTIYYSLSLSLSQVCARLSGQLVEESLFCQLFKGYISEGKSMVAMEITQQVLIGQLSVYQ